MRKHNLGNSNLEVSAPGLCRMRMSHDRNHFPIPGSWKLERLDENIGAVAIELTPDDLQEFKSAISKITVHGDRYSKGLAR